MSEIENFVRELVNSMKKEFPDLSEEEITRRLIDYAQKLHTQALERHTEEIVVKVLKRYKLIPE